MFHSCPSQDPQLLLGVQQWQACWLLIHLLLSTEGWFLSSEACSPASVRSAQSICIGATATGVHSAECPGLRRCKSEAMGCSKGKRPGHSRRSMLTTTNSHLLTAVEKATENISNAFHMGFSLQVYPLTIDSLHYSRLAEVNLKQLF